MMGRRGGGEEGVLSNQERDHVNRQGRPTQLIKYQNISLELFMNIGLPVFLESDSQHIKFRECDK